MSIVIVGANGSMGTRYRAILDSLEIKHTDLDCEHNRYEVLDAAKHSNGVIIASPTPTHENLLLTLSDSEVPVLCEKPVVKDLGVLVNVLEKFKGRFSMVMQYQYIPGHYGKYGKTSYDYFRHGNDGLVWDCFQIIALSNGEFHLAEKSPIWKCQINGSILSLSSMDQAYIDMVRAWLGGFDIPRQAIFNYHERVANYAKNFDCNPGAVYINQASEQNITKPS